MSMGGGAAFLGVRPPAVPGTRRGPVTDPNATGITLGGI